MAVYGEYNETDSWSSTPAIFLIAIKGTTGGTTATLSDLALSDGVAAITLDQTFASDEYEYQASVANSVSRITVTPTKSDSNATLDYLDGDDNVLPDADTVTEGQQVDLTSGENTIKMKVTAAADTATLTYTVKVTQKARITEVPVDWSLIPAGLTVRDKFRLLFLSSTTRDATSTDIADYNTFVQGIAAAGHAAIQAYSSGFRVVGCTGAVDARDNTYTRHTSTDQGVPIYWLGGTRVADEYEDFYDGSWDDEANDRNESGTDGPDTSQDENRPFTGCDHNGTEVFIGGTSEALGTSYAHVGEPNSSGSNAGPINGGFSAGAFSTQTRPMYGLSEVFQLEDVPLVTADFPQSTYTVAEGSDDSIAVTLSADPERKVTIPITRTNQGTTTDADYSDVPTEVTFESGDTEVTFTFTAAEDEVDDDDESVKVTFGALPVGVSAGTTTEVTVSITDNDVSGVTVSPTALTVTEEDTTGDSYTVVLDSQPTENVEVTVAGHSGTAVTPNPNLLTFTTSDWNMAQTVRVTAGSDADTVNDTVTLTPQRGEHGQQLQRQQHHDRQRDGDGERRRRGRPRRRHLRAHGRGEGQVVDANPWRK